MHPLTSQCILRMQRNLWRRINKTALDWSVQTWSSIEFICVIATSKRRIINKRISRLAKVMKAHNANVCAILCNPLQNRISCSWADVAMFLPLIPQRRQFTGAANKNDATTTKLKKKNRILSSKRTSSCVCMCIFAIPLLVISKQGPHIYGKDKADVSSWMGRWPSKSGWASKH